MVECDLAKVDVEGSNPFSRSKQQQLITNAILWPRAVGSAPLVTSFADSTRAPRYGWLMVAFGTRRSATVART